MRISDLTEGEVVRANFPKKPPNPMAAVSSEVRKFPGTVVLPDTFTKSYVACALWSSTDEDGESLDRFAISDIDVDSLREMVDDCRAFQEGHADLLDAAYERGYTAEQAGHDFWLTRNGHGAGFWDRQLGDVGKELTAMAKAYGGVDLHMDDDEIIHAS